MRRIAELRKARHLTQKELAEQLHIHPITLCCWETGRMGIRMENLKKVAKFFDVEPWELLTEESKVTAN